MGTYQIIKGKLNEDYDLHSESRRRKVQYFEKSIGLNDTIPEGWVVDTSRKFKTRRRIKKLKDGYTKLQDTIWNIFYQIGIPLISTGPLVIECVKGAQIGKKYEFDLAAVDNDVVFIILCRTGESQHLRVKDILLELSENKSDIRSAFKSSLNISKLKFVFIFASENIIWKKQDRIIALNNDILVWEEGDIIALDDLAKLAGEGAKYQLYNRIFYNTKIRHFKVKVPALKAKMGGYTYYSFVLSPQHLLQIAYVHQRGTECEFIEIADSYQRMLNKKRINAIEQFIENGGFFPGSIIINFNKPLQNIEKIGTMKQLNDSWGDATPVLITLPPYYGSAWIIDGQHRLYGYGDTDEKVNETVPVIAFVQENREFQAKIFVEINKNQKAIPPDLLWDLYEDLYVHSDNSNEMYLYAISMASKYLNYNEESPFYKHIDILKEHYNIDEANISLNTMCNRIRQLKLIHEDEGPLFYNNYYDSIQYAGQRISAFFEVIKEVLTDEWESGKKHYIRTNAALTVFLGILSDILKGSATKREIESIRFLKDVVYRWLEPLLLYILDSDADNLKRFRSPGGASGGSTQIRVEFTKIMVEANTGFRSPWLEEYERKLKITQQLKKTKRSIKYYLDKDESDALEFKGTWKLNLQQLIHGDGSMCDNPDVTKKIIQTITAYLNCDGGIIITGVIEMKFYSEEDLSKLNNPIIENDKCIIGIEYDYGKRGWEGYLQSIINNIKNKISKTVYDTGLVKIDKYEYQGKDLCKIEVSQSKKKQYYQGDFYIRSGPETIQLSASDIDEYWDNRNK